MSERAGKVDRACVLARAAVGSLAFLAPATAQGAGSVPDPQPFTAVEASAQLDQAIAAFSGGDPEAADPTNELRDLVAALPVLEGRERRRARALLARPPAHNGAGLDDAGGIEPFGAEWSELATASRQQYESPGGGFVIHYVTVSSDAPDLADGGDPGTVPDYVEQVAARADSSRMVENDDLGWPPPKSDGARGGGSGLTDVYLADICEPSACFFGYAGPDDSSRQCGRPPFECFAYLVLDDDYAPDEFGYPDPDIPLSVTVAHEYNHILQFAIDTMQDAWMFESTATWSEEQVFPLADDWLFYVDTWVRQSQQPITKFGAGGGLRVYGSAVWNHWLTLGAGYGPGVVLDSWQSSRQSEPKDFAVGAYNLGIKANGGEGFAQEFARFAAATSEWRVDDDDFQDEEDLPDVRRHGELRWSADAERFKLDHTAYRLFRVDPETEDTVTLRVLAARGVRTGIALVAREGDPETGTLTESLDYLRRGGRGTVELTGAQGFDRITAVITNADGRVRTARRGGQRYTRDNEPFRISLR